MTISRYFHVNANDIIYSFSWLHSIPLCTLLFHVYHIFFIHSSGDGHWGACIFLSYAVLCVHSQDWDCWVMSILIFVCNFICLLFVSVLGLCCCMDFSLVVVSQGFYSLQCAGFPLWWLLLLWSPGSGKHRFQELWRAISVGAAHWF